MMISWLQYLLGLMPFRWYFMLRINVCLNDSWSKHNDTCACFLHVLLLYLIWYVWWNMLCKLFQIVFMFNCLKLMSSPWYLLWHDIAWVYFRYICNGQGGLITHPTTVYHYRKMMTTIIHITQTTNATNNDALKHYEFKYFIIPITITR